MRSLIWSWDRIRDKVKDRFCFFFSDNRGRGPWRQPRVFNGNRLDLSMTLPHLLPFCVCQSDSGGFTLALQTLVRPLSCFALACIKMEEETVRRRDRHADVLCSCWVSPLFNFAFFRLSIVGSQSFFSLRFPLSLLPLPLMWYLVPETCFAASWRSYWAILSGRYHISSCLKTTSEESLCPPPPIPKQPFIYGAALYAEEMRRDVTGQRGRGIEAEWRNLQSAKWALIRQGWVRSMGVGGRGAGNEMEKCKGRRKQRVMRTLVSKKSTQCVAESFSHVSFLMHFLEVLSK